MTSFPMNETGLAKLLYGTNQIDNTTKLFQTFFLSFFCVQLSDESLLNKLFIPILVSRETQHYSVVSKEDEPFGTSCLS